MNDKVKKGKRGPAPFQPTEQQRKQVRMMAGMGIQQVNIGKIIGVSDETLRKHFRDELDTGTDMANMAVASNLYSIATSNKPGAVPAAIFWMKTRGRWSETNKTEITGANGGPIEGTFKIDVKKFDADQRAMLKELIMSAKVGAGNEDDDEEE